MTLKITNNASALLAVGIDADDTAIAVTPGAGAKFPTLAGDEWFPLVVVDAAGGLEIMRATARATDVITVLRAQENTVGRIFASGARVELRLTRAALEAMPTLTPQLLARDGEVAAPAYSFAGDPDSGLYRVGANNLGVAVNGAKVVDIGTVGAAVTGALSATGDVTHHGSLIVPVGSILEYAGSSEPNGWLFCYGQAISRTTYSALFTALSTTYGVGDGSTTFNLPDLRGRVVAGQDDMGGSSANRLTAQTGGVNGDTLGATGGAETTTLVTGNLPAYTPAGTVGITDPGHTHSVPSGGGAVTNFGTTPPGSGGQTTGSSTTGVTASFTGTAQGGTSAPVNNVQPTIILNKMIFTGVYA